MDNTLRAMNDTVEMLHESRIFRFCSSDNLDQLYEITRQLQDKHNIENVTNFLNTLNDVLGNANFNYRVAKRRNRDLNRVSFEKNILLIKSNIDYLSKIEEYTSPEADLIFKISRTVKSLHMDLDYQIIMPVRYLNTPSSNVAEAQRRFNITTQAMLKCFDDYLSIVGDDYLTGRLLKLKPIAHKLSSTLNKFDKFVESSEANIDIFNVFIKNNEHYKRIREFHDELEVIALLEE